MRFFLKLKHWQLFLLFIGLPFILRVSSFFEVTPQNELSPLFKLTPLILIYLILLFSGWIYALTTNLHPKLPVNVYINIKRFKIYLTIAVAYIAFLCLFLFILFSGYLEFDLNPIIGLLIMPLHVFSLFALLHCSYVTAKTIKAVEIQRPVSFSDFAGEFILLWIYVIGIWIIQPKINKIFKDSE